MADFWVNGIVAQRDKQPYIQLSNEKGMIAQLTMAQARQVAHGDGIAHRGGCHADQVFR